MRTSWRYAKRGVYVHEAGSRANIKLHSVGTHIPDEEEEEEERGRGYVASEKVKEKARERLGRVVNELFVAVNNPSLFCLSIDSTTIHQKNCV